MKFTQGKAQFQIAQLLYFKAICDTLLPSSEKDKHVTIRMFYIYYNKIDH